MGKRDEAEKVHDSPCKVTFITDGSQTNLERLNPHAEGGPCVDFRENVSNWSRGTANSVLHGKCFSLLIGTKLTAFIGRRWRVPRVEFQENLSNIMPDTAKRGTLCS
jgi:hypothetical protein